MNNIESKMTKKRPTLMQRSFIQMYIEDIQNDYFHLTNLV